MTEEKALQVLPQIEAVIKINQKDLVTVAVAEGENQMREKLRELRGIVNKLKAQIKETNKRVKKLGETHLRKKLKAKYDALRDAVYAFNKLLGDGMQMDIIVNDNPRSDLTNYNTAKIFLRKDRENAGTYRDRSMVFWEEDFEFTAEQKKLVEKLEKLENDKKDTLNEAMRWRKRLSDIPSLERQIRARVVKDQMQKTKEGRALIDAMMTNFTDTVKMLGI